MAKAWRSTKRHSRLMVKKTRSIISDITISPHLSIFLCLNYNRGPRKYDSLIKIILQIYNYA